MAKGPGIHEDLRREHEIKGSSNRAFGIVFAIFFTVVGLFPLVFGGDEVRIWSLAIAGAFLLVALVYPRVFTVPNRLWMKFALLLSMITTPIIMGMMFFVTFTPIALIMRAFGADPLKRDLNRGQEKSYWVERDVTMPEPGSMKNMF